MSVAATTRSQASTSLAPPARAGAADRGDDRLGAWVAHEAGEPAALGARSSAARPAAIVFRSAPAQKVGPAPVRMLTQTSSSASKLLAPRPRAPIASSGLTALRASGRSSVTRRDAPLDGVPDHVAHRRPGATQGAAGGTAARLRAVRSMPTGSPRWRVSGSLRAASPDSGGPAGTGERGAQPVEEQPVRLLRLLEQVAVPGAGHHRRASRPGIAAASRRALATGVSCVARRRAGPASAPRSGPAVPGCRGRSRPSRWLTRPRAEVRWAAEQPEVAHGTGRAREARKSSLNSARPTSCTPQVGRANAPRRGPPPPSARAGRHVARRGLVHPEHEPAHPVGEPDTRPPGRSCRPSTARRRGRCRCRSASSSRTASPASSGIEVTRHGAGDRPAPRLS